MSAYKNFNVIRIGCSPGPALFLVLSVLRDIRCDVYESERCLVSRRPFPGRKIFFALSLSLSRRLTESPDAKSGGPVCAQISIHAALLLVEPFLFCCRATYTYLGFGIERRDTRRLRGDG